MNLCEYLPQWFHQTRSRILGYTSQGAPSETDTSHVRPALSTSRSKHLGPSTTSPPAKAIHPRSPSHPFVSSCCVALPVEFGQARALASSNDRIEIRAGLPARIQRPIFVHRRLVSHVRISNGTPSGPAVANATSPNVEASVPGSSSTAITPAQSRVADAGGLELEESSLLVQPPTAIPNAHTAAAAGNHFRFQDERHARFTLCSSPLQKAPQSNGNCPSEHYRDRVTRGACRGQYQQERIARTDRGGMGLGAFAVRAVVQELLREGGC